ncbi:hypothetical protein HYU13_04505 [Candidatus Woesearchaeota archaeon]|nr:hypothetical protein [Candidatus Woesearchaeota archaeon]
MKSKKGTQAGYFAFFMYFIFLFVLLMFVTQCVKPKLAGSKDIEVKTAFEDQNSNAFLYGLLEQQHDGKKLIDLLAYSPPESRKGEITVALVAILDSIDPKIRFQLFLDDAFFTEHCPDRCRAGELQDTLAITLPIRNSNPKKFTLKIFRENK